MDGSVTQHIAASPQRVWGLVSDITRIGAYSPETFEAEWLDGATGPVVGARFRGHVKRNGKGPTYWTTCTVTASVPGREFAFSVGSPDKPLNTWRYQLEAIRDGVDVTESFALGQQPALRVYWRLFGWARSRTNRNGMRTTLERIRGVAESALAEANPGSLGANPPPGVRPPGLTAE